MKNYSDTEDKADKVFYGMHAVTAAGASEYLSPSSIYKGWLNDMVTLEYNTPTYMRMNIWSRSGEKDEEKLKAAKRLATAGLVFLEDTFSGPVVTMTWRGFQEWLRLSARRG